MFLVNFLHLHDDKENIYWNIQTYLEVIDKAVRRASNFCKSNNLQDVICSDRKWPLVFIEMAKSDWKTLCFSDVLAHSSLDSIIPNKEQLDFVPNDKDVSGKEWYPVEFILPWIPQRR